MLPVVTYSLNRDETNFLRLLEGGKTVVEAFAVFFQTLHRFLIFQSL